jgi:hypothetical protein
VFNVAWSQYNISSLCNEVTKQANAQLDHKEYYGLVPITRISVALNDRLPAQKGIGHSVNDIPDIGRVSLVQSDRGYVPHRSHILLMASVERSKHPSVRDGYRFLII